MSSKAFQSFGTAAVFRIAFPLMLVALTSNMMLFVGRMVLAKYDIHTMNAAASSMLVCSIFQIAGLSITTIAEIFVGQHNGAGNLKQVPNAVWQMIWFSLALTIIFVPIALFGCEFLIAEKFKALGARYFEITMLSGFLVPLLGALASFFIGTGQSSSLIVSSVIANSVNVGLNIALVFGVENLIPPMGASGAAISTTLALSGQVVFLFLVFINDENHRVFGTRRLTVDAAKMIKCINIGFPNALGRMAEITGWASIIAYLSTVDESYVTVQTLCHSLIVMFMFTAEGLSKGVTAIVSNVIGRGDLKAVSKIVRSSRNILLIILAMLWVVLWYVPELTLLKLMNEAQFVDVELKNYIMLALKGLWVYFVFNGFSLIIWGVLTAGGDTRFIMLSNTLSTWLFAVIPTYVCVAYFHITPAIPYQYVAPVYGFLGLVIVFIRYHSKKWLKLNLATKAKAAA